MVGIHARNFGRDVTDHLPADAVDRGRGNRVHVHMPSVVALLCRRERERASESSGEDPMLVDGSDSPALERYRLARAKTEELNYAVKSGEYVAIADLRSGWDAAVGLIRQAIERLQRQFGNEAGELMDEAIEDADRAIRETLKRSDDSSDEQSGG